MTQHLFPYVGHCVVGQVLGMEIWRYEEWEYKVLGTWGIEVCGSSYGMVQRFIE